MGLFSSDGKTRAQRKAERKALKAKAKYEAKFESKDRRKAAKAERKAEHRFREQELALERKNGRKLAKVERKNAKAQVKIAQAEAKTVAAEAKAAADAKPFSPASVRRYLTVARMVAPIVAPIAYRAAVAGRGRIAGLQAERAGVAPGLLSQYSGHGAPLAARIATTRTSLQKVAAQDSSADSRAFVAAMTKRLDNLSIAVDAAEPMSAAQRRTAHRAITDELSAIDADILARLGVRA
ncbi:hypothetical protein GYA93_20465 [Gordonia desulfuricans]|uniref:Uncharacterized protein n=1 Tax=Gordonia desulfuricans TaxID=89051 RepID=A0A7K3LUJ7_9ACTN|nr:MULTISPECIES: DUF6474 family protein [Gordonia]KOY49044.1 hypothetical protein ISGA_12695 [Gordonia sp. NB41Y]NDK91922.1 hypothetical protein [Gordonia desulfuricans]WLP92790.1 DUF6474 family protein [Gordonia sp. NB41Y]